MLKILSTGCPGLSPTISAQFTVKLLAAQNREKITKTRILNFIFVLGDQYCYPRKARQQCLLRQAARLFLSAAVFTLN